MEKKFDQRFGGFGNPPKFPSPHNLGFLLRYAYDHPESHALRMVHITLDKMRKGGIYDHIGYGFARYSTGKEWLVPHFEKMLYDNALLAIAYIYIEAYQFEHEPVYEEKAREIFRYVMREAFTQRRMQTLKVKKVNTMSGPLLKSIKSWVTNVPISTVHENESSLFDFICAQQDDALSQ